MFSLGIDIGSTYTKYCILSGQRGIEDYFCERTPVRQKEYFEKKLAMMRGQRGDFLCASCGYGRTNAGPAARTINELSALAAGVDFVCPEYRTVLDIGGQDTKIICQENGKLKAFFANDRCAAGSGMFLANTLRLLEIDFAEIDLRGKKPDLRLSSACAVFAQTEIVELIAANVSAEDIVKAVLCQIFCRQSLF